MKSAMRSACLLSIWFFQGALAAHAIQVYSPTATTLGRAVTVFVRSAPDIRAMTVRLFDSSGIAVNAARGFPYTAAPGAKAWIAILAIPSTLEGGSYRIRASIGTTDGTLRAARGLFIAPRTFEKEVIPLDAVLSRLQALNSRSKRAQAAKLWSMITTFRPDAVYQRGPFIMPTKEYRVSSPYGARRFFAFARGGGQYSVHQGVDLAMPAGTLVRATGAGRVVSARSWLMTGNTVVIENLPEVYSLYFHFSRMDVHPGEIVKQGQVIGLSGATGLATGPVLDYKVEVEGVAVDPLRLLRHSLIDTRAVLARLK